MDDDVRCDAGQWGRVAHRGGGTRTDRCVPNAGGAAQGGNGNCCVDGCRCGGPFFRKEEGALMHRGRAMCFYAVRASSVRSLCSIGATIGIVSIVLTTAINSNAVNVSLVMMFISSSTFAKMIMMSAFVCRSHPIREASPAC